MLKAKVLFKIPITAYKPFQYPFPLPLGTLHSDTYRTWKGCVINASSEEVYRHLNLPPHHWDTYSISVTNLHHINVINYNLWQCPRLYFLLEVFSLSHRLQWKYCFFYYYWFFFCQIIYCFLLNRPTACHSQLCN